MEHVSAVRQMRNLDIGRTAGRDERQLAGRVDQSDLILVSRALDR